MSKLRKYNCEDNSFKYVKSWGYEAWLHNDDKYCSKLLHFDKKGVGTSLHYHIKKTETMFVITGGFTIKCIDPENAEEYDIELDAGDFVDILPGHAHQIVPSCANSELIESSTFHEDADSYRIRR